MQTSDLEELLDHARRNNASAGITGALVYAEGRFLQVLEGDKVLVLDLLAKIRQDVRHENVTLLRAGEVPVPIFGSWKMAYVSATPQQVAAWAGFSVASGTSSRLNETAEEQDRTAQFAQDILSLLVADNSAEARVD